MSEIQFRIIREQQRHTKKNRYRIQSSPTASAEWGFLFGSRTVFDDIEPARAALKTFQTEMAPWDFIEEVNA